MDDIKANPLGDIEQLIICIKNISEIIKAVEKLLKEKGMIPYDVEKITTDDLNGKEKSMGDMFKERKRMQVELENKLINHKSVPYVSSEHGDFITKIAASILDNTDILESHLRANFDAKIESMLKRYKELSFFYVKEKPRKLIINRLKEAIDCYVYGFFQGCAILCRSTLETSLREKIKEKIGPEQINRKTLRPLLDDAIRLGIISRRDDEIANKVKSIGNESVHDSKRCSSSEAFESLTNTKVLLGILYK